MTSDADSSISRASFAIADVVSPASSVIRSTSCPFFTEVTSPFAHFSVPELVFPCSQPSPKRPRHQRQDTLNGAFCSTLCGRAPLHATSLTAFRSQLADVGLVHLFHGMTIVDIVSLATSLRDAVTRSTSCPSFT